MQYFYSRRTFNQSTGRFSNNPASLTRYVALGETEHPATKGHLLKASDWAKAVFADSANNEVVIFVHGYNTDQGEMLARMNLIAKGLKRAGYGGKVVSFDWPSDGSPSPEAYRRDWRDAKAVARNMVMDGVKLLRETRPGAKVHLIAHSLGAFLSLRGFGVVGDAFFPGQVDEAVFIAADADQDWMIKGAWGALVMGQRCKRLTNYYSEEDVILDLGGRFLNHGTKRSGRHGIKPDPAPRFFDVSCSDRYKTDIPTNSQTSIKSHNWYFDSDFFYEDLARTLSGKSANTMPTREAHGGGDQRLKP